MAADIDRLVSFEEAHYDQYDYYNLEEYPCHAGGKGRSKKEIGLNTNRHCPAGHERKIAGKLQNSEIKRRRTKSSSSWGTRIEVSMIRCVLMHICWETCPGKSSALFAHQLPLYVTTRDQIFITCTHIFILLRIFLMHYYFFFVLHRIRPHILEMDEWNRIVVQMSVLPFSRPTECWSHSARGARMRICSTFCCCHVIRWCLPQQFWHE